MDQRNLLVLGRTGVGKSTVVNHIVGKTVFTVSTSLEGVTRETRTSREQTERDTEDDEGNVRYKIKIIDTVGLRDNVKGRTEETIKELKDYIPREAHEGVNLILFVIRKGVFSEEEKQTFDSIIKNCKKDIKEMSALVITGCEALSTEGRDEEIRATKTDQDTKPLAVMMGKGIYAVGFPSLDNLKPFLKEEYEEGIKTDTEKLRNVVLNSDVYQDIIRREMSMFSNKTLIICAAILSIMIAIRVLFVKNVLGTVYSVVVQISKRVFLFVKNVLGTVYSVVVQTTSTLKQGIQKFISLLVTWAAQWW